MSNEIELSNGMESTEDTFWPDGYREGDDVFNPDSWTGGTAADEQTDGIGADDGVDSADTDGYGSTTAGESSGNEQGVGGTETDSDPDGGGDAGDDSPFVFDATVNHQAPERVDLRGMSKEELRAMYQKSKAFDEMKDKSNRDKYHEIVERQVQEGMTDEVAKMVAAAAVGGKHYDDDPADDGEQQERSADTRTKGDGRDYGAEIEEVRDVYPDFKGIPDEVARRAAETGHSLLREYAKFRAENAAKAAAKMQKENKVLKQNAENAARSPARGTTGSGKIKDDLSAEDKALYDGFDSNAW